MIGTGQVPGKNQPDMSCVPYRRKSLYFVVTIPLLVVLLLVSIYLWGFSPVLTIVFIAFYLLTCYFQAYCCAYQDCPYIGGFCPAIIGILPANLLAKLIYERKRIAKSRTRFGIQATLAFLAWLGLAGFPVFWIAKLDTLLAAGYVVCHIVHYVTFGLTICPVCAIRGTCPGGKLQHIVLGERGKQAQ